MNIGRGIIPAQRLEKLTKTLVVCSLKKHSQTLKISSPHIRSILSVKLVAHFKEEIWTLRHEDEVNVKTAASRQEKQST